MERTRTWRGSMRAFTAGEAANTVRSGNSGFNRLMTSPIVCVRCFGEEPTARRSATVVSRCHGRP